MIRRTTLLAAALAALACLAPAAQGAEAPCELTPRSQCYGLESVQASLSTTQAGAHPDFSFDFSLKEDPEIKNEPFGTAYAPTRDVRIELPPGLIGNPNILGAPQLCTVQQLVNALVGEGCPNGSQVGVTTISFSGESDGGTEPVYMMQPPGGDVIARLGFIGLFVPFFIDAKVRSDSDYGLTLEVIDGSSTVRLVKVGATTWGVPADPSHDTERCTPKEVEKNCKVSLPRPPATKPLPFLTNPTRCGVPLSLSVNVSSWSEPELVEANKKEASLPAISGCNKLPYGPALTVNPTNHHTSSPTGLDLTIQLPEAEGVKVLEPAQTRDIRIDLPAGIAINPGGADGLGVCSTTQVGFGKNEDSHCPDSAKMATAEFEVAALSRRMKGAIYLREPEPGNLFRIWIVADDLGAHVKLPGQLEVDKGSGQIKSVVLDTPQVPLREAKLLFKSGFRAPLMTPSSCDTYLTHYDFASWAAGPHATGDVPMQISEGCDTGSFSPKLSAGSTNAQGGAFAPFSFTINREDSEQNIAGLNLTLPRGMAASFAGIPRCEGEAAQTGHCPPASRIGRTTVADGAGPNPLWVPQPGKDPTAIYLSGPYKGAPISIVAVVPAQAGPFDLGLEVVRSAVFVDPASAQATAVADPLPQLIEGIPITYKTINVVLDRPGFALNPTSCAQKQTSATLTSPAGKIATPTSPYAASNCAKLGFSPRLALKLRGGTKRGGHPALRGTFRPHPGDANASSLVVRLPHSAFLDQAHIRTICTRVQYAAGAGNGAGCPAGSIYGQVTAYTPLLEEPLSGPVYLRSSNHNLPDLVMVLHGPASIPIVIEAVGRVDSLKGGIRTSFEAIPDAPLSKVVLEMQGAKKGLIVNSTDVCKGSHRADVSLKAHNGKAATVHPELSAACGGKRKR